VNEFFAQFHFLRPAWLFALIAIIPLLLMLWRQHKQAGQWQSLISPELLPFLLEGKTHRISPLRISLLAFAWLIACVALAGPSWQQLPVAIEKNQSAMVILLDLSPSMLTEDIKPSRIVRARLKIADLLRERQDGQTALLVYAANAHVVTPLTDDVKTITNLLPLLTPAIMPASGSNTEEAISRAINLLQDASLTSGDLLLITDGIADEALPTINEILSKQKGIRLSILGVGGHEPAPIPSRNGGFVRDSQNSIVTSSLDVAPLRSLATNYGGRYKTLSNDATEMQLFNQLANPENNNQDKQSKKSDEFDQWADAGYWLIFLLLPFIAFAFRRGMVLSFLLLPALLVTPDNSYALSWDELWKNQDQRAYEKLQNEQPAEAAKQFKREDWQSAAQYRAGQYAEAAKQYEKDTSATGHYNRGNALAKAGQLPEAIKAYNQALSLNPGLEDAKKNRQVVEDALKKQQQQDQQQNQENQNQKEQGDQKNQGDQKDQQQSEQNESQGKESSSESQQNSSASTQDSQSNQQEENSQTQSSSGQNASAAATGSSSSSDNQSMQESLDKNQQAASSIGSQAAIQQEQTSSSAASQANPAQQQMVPDDGLTDEERKQLEQWLRRVQDDPSGLLRKKFEYEHYKQRQQKMNGTWEAPANEADQRL
jgi:Ca-activated chloride channel homolog